MNDDELSKNNIGLNTIDEHDTDNIFAKFSDDVNENTFPGFTDWIKEIAHLRNDTSHPETMLNVILHYNDFWKEAFEYSSGYSPKVRQQMLLQVSEIFEPNNNDKNTFYKGLSIYNHILDRFDANDGFKHYSQYSGNKEYKDYLLNLDLYNAIIQTKKINQEQNESPAELYIKNALGYDLSNIENKRYQEYAFSNPKKFPSYLLGETAHLYNKFLGSWTNPYVIAANAIYENGIRPDLDINNRNWKSLLASTVLPFVVPAAFKKIKNTFKLIPKRKLK